MKAPAIICLTLTVAAARAQTPPRLDTLFFGSGEPAVGKVVAVDATTIRVQRPLPAPPGAPPQAAPVFATVSIPRADVDRIEFAADPVRDELLRTATPAKLPELEALWQRNEPLLALPKSPAGTIGLIYGDMLLRSGQPANATRALALFREIETRSWNPDNLMLARQGRLRAMVATGQASAAVKEAAELAKLSEDPAVLVEAKFILAEAAASSLRQLVADNPRWQEDIFVIPERHRLYNEALDLYLYPYLFFGSETEAAARGLWGAAEVYQFTGEIPAAVESARDLTAIYPGTKYAALAEKFLAGLPEDQRQFNPEKDAQNESQNEK
jgi:hypothetical protein